jgi:hypothetical protein
MERHLLPRRGRLVTWTTQGFLPKEPYAGGETADLQAVRGGPGRAGRRGPRRGRLTEADPAKLEFDAEFPSSSSFQFRTEGDTEIVTFAFRPL